MLYNVVIYTHPMANNLRQIAYRNLVSRRLYYVLTNIHTYASADPTHKASIGSDKMKMIVKKLCNRDPHQFFQRLETLARSVPFPNPNPHSTHPKTLLVWSVTTIEL